MELAEVRLSFLRVGSAKACLTRFLAVVKLPADGDGLNIFTRVRAVFLPAAHSPWG